MKVIICGQYFGRVRALINEEGKRLKEAAPSVAVKVLGLNGVPEAGLEFSVVEDERAARDAQAQVMSLTHRCRRLCTSAFVALEMWLCTMFGTSVVGGRPVKSNEPSRIYARAD